ncbi:hypothetical protein [Paraburkholderia fungorum]|nr:hypothetical protein [Paraburkholderia fungorum]
MINWNVTLLGPERVHPHQDGYPYKEQQYFPTMLSAVNKVLAK